MPQVKTCGEMAVKPLPVTHILVHFAMKSADDAGARITKVEEQSALRGWLCAGDLVLSVNGEALAAGSGAMLARQFEQSLRDKPNFEIAIEPIEETAGLQPGRQSAKSRICGEDWSKAVTPPRRC
ncbi:MAG: hypothetical protein HC850_15120 [Rhodomicrobium sp.]|nr:hypothetical protein [Rhodomicrobium sp.]